MGGKQNRTRNNVRPSNSGRSAAMLHSSLPQFAGFSGGNKPTGLSSFAFNPTEEFDTSIDDNFQLVLKKVSKKDCTTKLKGLQEFAELLQNAELTVVKTLLPVWPRFYSVLVIHPDNRVREVTQNVHHIIVLKVKRDIAPYLKQLMAPWYTSQYDNYPPAATIAVQAFKDTFSPVKFKEAVNFCHHEILNYIHDNLLNQSAQTISSNQLSPQEAEAKYERVVISCLLGYSMYLKDISEEKIAESMSLHTQIVSNKKFWKLATSKVPLVKSAWFQVLSVILQKVVSLLKSRESQTISIILNNLEDEPAVSTHVWECLLLATSIQEWWKCINIEQLFIPKILNILKQAGNGHATIIYPHLLPLLSNVPSMEEKKKKQFYVNFFENMTLGIKLKSVASNTQESKALAAAYVECLQFLIAKNLSNATLCKTLLKQFCNLIEWCLTKEAVSYKAVFSQTTNFVSYLRRNSNSEEIKTITEFFFNSLHDIFYKSINNPSNNHTIVAEKQVELLLMLNSDKQSSPSNNEPYSNLIEELAVKICEIFLSYIEQASIKDLFGQLYLLINGFGKNAVLGKLLDKLKEDGSQPQYMDIYRKWLKNWLWSDTMYCESVLDIVFMLFVELQEQDKQTILDDLLKCNQPNCITWSVSKVLTLSLIEDRAVQSWLKGEAVGNLFLTITRRYTANECDEEQANIFKLALSENCHGDILISKEILHQIIEHVESSLLNDVNENVSVDSSCRLAADICKVIYTDSHQLTYGEKLLLALFNLSCKFDREHNSVSFDTVSLVSKVWRNSLVILLKNLNQSDSETLIEKFFKIIEDSFTSTIVSRHRGNMDHLNNMVIEVVESIYRSRIYLLEWLVKFLSKKSWINGEKIVGLCKVAEYIKGSLDSPFDEIVMQHSVEKEEILSFFVYNFLKIHVLSTTLHDGERSENNSDDEAEIINSDIKIFNFSDAPANNLLDVIYSYTVSDTFLTHFNNIQNYNEIIHYHRSFEQRICDMFRCVDEDTLTKLKQSLKSNCLNHGWFWCRTVYLFYTRYLKAEDIFKVYSEFNLDVAGTDSIGMTHLRQEFKNVSDENLDSAELFAQIERLRNEHLPQFLYEVSDLSWQQTNKVVNAVKQCTELMRNYPLNRRYWDFIVLSMVSWVSNCFKAKRLIKQYQYQSLLVSISELYIATCIKMEELAKEQTDESYVNEWEDVLLEGIHADIAQIWIFLADHFSKSLEDPLLNLPLLQYYGKSTDYIRHDLIFKGNENLPKWTKFMKISACTLLTNSQSVLQLWGYKMLLILVPGLVKIDEKSVDTTTPHKNGLIFEQFKEKLIEIQDIVNSVLVDFRIGENSCKVEPSYDSFTYIFAYLLLWDALLNLCDKASTELKFQYFDWLKNSSLVYQFLLNLFKLMPTEVLQHDEVKAKSATDTFGINPVDSACYSDFCGSDTIEHLACYLYKSSLEQFPALVRQWWTVLDIKTSPIVEKVTELYVSPHICNMELNNVLQHQNAFKNLKVKVMPTVREIQAVYTVDESQMELSITLPPNYPLGSPNILCNRQISGTSQKQWLLQFKKCVLHQNGKIWDGLSLWNSNLDRKFDGVEECYVCYAVLHAGTYQLPKLSCQTCKKKFHSACLYKWFSTSNKSSCPICRNLF